MKLMRRYIYILGLSRVVILCTKKQIKPASKSQSSNSPAFENANSFSETLEKASRIANATRDYLPYYYTADGCYARALFVSVELALQGIASNQQYIGACNSEKKLKFDNKTS